MHVNHLNADFLAYIFQSFRTTPSSFSLHFSNSLSFQYKFRFSRADNMRRYSVRSPYGMFSLSVSKKSSNPSFGKRLIHLFNLLNSFLKRLRVVRDGSANDFIDLLFPPRLPLERVFRTNGCPCSFCDRFEYRRLV